MKTTNVMRLVLHFEVGLKDDNFDDILIGELIYKYFIGLVKDGVVILCR